MGRITVHEFTTVDGVVDVPMWTMDYGFTPQLAEAIGGLTSSATAILLGRTTFEMFAPAWSQRTVEDDPGAPFFNETRKYVVASQQPHARTPLALLGVEEMGNGVAHLTYGPARS